MMKIKFNQSLNQNTGFTIIELLIATSVMTVLLLIASVTVVEIGKLYFKGNIVSQTQSTARNVIDGVARPIQLEGSSIIGPTTIKDLSITPPIEHKIQSICIGTTRYTYVIGLKNNPIDYDGDSIRHALWRDEVENPDVCKSTNPDEYPDLTKTDPAGTVGKNGVDMLGNNMRLVNFNINPAGITGSNLWNIEIGVIYGDKDLIDFEANGKPMNCKSQIAGSQWCAMTNYQTMVLKRINGG